MALLFKKPFIFIVTGVIIVVLVIHLSGVFEPRTQPTVIVTPSISPSIIRMTESANLTSIIRNSGQSPYLVEYRILGVFNSHQLIFYDTISSENLSNPGWNGENYTIIYPTTWLMNTEEERTISITIEGLDPKVDSATYTIFVEVYADNVLAERKSIQLTVNRS